MAYAELTNRATGDVVLEADHDQIRENFDALSIGMTPGGRLCGVTADPAGDSPSTATLYYTPYLHNGVKLYDGANWVYYNFSEISLSLTGLTDAYNHDVFLYNNAGTLTLETTQWTNATTRATAITRQDGVYVRSGSTGRLYLGTIRASATGQTIDSVAFRYIWNMYNRIVKNVLITDTTDSWTYSTATWRSWNNNIGNSIGMVRGLDENLTDVTFTAIYSGGHPVVSLNVGGAGKGSLASYGSSSSDIDLLSVRYCAKPGIGYRFLALSELVLTGTTTFYGDATSANIQSGASGYVKC